MRQIKHLLDLIGLPGDLETIGRIGVWFGLSSMTGGWAYLTEGGPWAVFIATGVFCFGVVAARTVRVWADHEDLKNKIRIHDLVPIIRPAGDNTFDIRLRYCVHNHSEFPIYYDDRDSMVSIGDRLAEPASERNIALIASKQLMFHSTGWIKLVSFSEDREIRFSIEVLYGKKIGQHTHKLRYKATAYIPAKNGRPDTQSGAYEATLIEYENI